MSSFETMITVGEEEVEISVEYTKYYDDITIESVTDEKGVELQLSREQLDGLVEKASLREDERVRERDDD